MHFHFSYTSSLNEKGTKNPFLHLGHGGYIQHLQLSSAIILMIATFMGLPISHSHVIVFCIIGMNIAMNKEVDYKNIGKMSVFWVLTFPVAAILAGLVYFGFIFIGFY